MRVFAVNRRNDPKAREVYLQTYLNRMDEIFRQRRVLFDKRAFTLQLDEEGRVGVSLEGVFRRA